MRRVALPLSASVILLLTISASYASIPLHLWSQHFGDLSTQAGYAVAVDGSGNVFVTGRFAGQVSLGGATLFGAGNHDIFLAKYDANGAHLWSQRFGSTGPDEGLSVAVDGSGNVIVTGYFQYTVDFGGGNLVSNGFLDFFVAKYGPNGTHLWSQHYGSTGAEYGRAVAVDGSGNVIVSGNFEGTVDFGGGNLVSAGNADIFLAKYDASGTHQWSQSFGSTGIDRGYGVAVDGSGNVILTGAFIGTVDFGGGNLVSAGGDIFLAKYDANGTHQWSQGLGSFGDDVGRAVAVDGSGNVILTGWFRNSVDFGGGSLVSAGGDDIFLAKYDANGAHQWSRRFGSTADDQGYSVAVDGSGNVLATGGFIGTVDFGGGNLVGAGDSDIFFAKYDSNGTHRSSQRFGDTGEDYGRSLAVDGSENAVMGGWFYGSIDFGGGSLTSAGVDDIFLTKFSGIPVEPTITSISDIGNDQGGQVLIEFERSAHDDPQSSFGIAQYEAYRRIDPAPATASPWNNSDVSPGLLPLDLGWTYVGMVPAHGKLVYSMVVPTIGDSTIAAGQYYSAFFIRAATVNPFVFCDSAPDSGYSLDNLAPAVPASLVYSAGQLSWVAIPPVDFNYFTVYGSNMIRFETAVVIDNTVASTMNVASSPYVYYFVTATDFSGNESGPVELGASTGVGGTPRSYVLSVANFPNPFNPRTMVRYTVPSSARVTVAVYDTRGALVATLVDNELRDAGGYATEWNSRLDSDVTVPFGMYFLRIQQNGVSRSKKIVLLR